MLNLRIDKMHDYDAYAVHLLGTNPDGSRYYVVAGSVDDRGEITFRREPVEEDKGYRIDPLFRLTGPFLHSIGGRNAAQDLVDRLFELFKVVPAEAKKSEGRVHGKLEATELHLGDMRRLVEIYTKGKVMHEILQPGHGARAPDTGDREETA